MGTPCHGVKRHHVRQHETLDHRHPRHHHRPTVGSRVCLTRFWKRHGPLKPGQEGVLVRDAHDYQPYYVRASNGRRWWYYQNEITTCHGVERHHVRQHETLHHRRPRHHHRQAMETRLTHLRRAKEIEALERKKWVKSAIAVLKREEKQTSKQMIRVAMRKEEKMIRSKQFTAAKKLRTALQKLTGRLVRQLMAQFEKELSHAKAEREQRVEQQDSKLRKLMAAIDRIGSH